MRVVYRGLMAALLCSAMVGGAWAQLRTIPADTKRAKLTHVRENIVKLDDKEMRLAPGGLIRDTNNVIVLPTMVPDEAPVRYQLDGDGMVSRVWILSPEEVAKEPPPPKPTPKPGTKPAPGTNEEDGKK